jgi:hypothetical protein
MAFVTGKTYHCRNRYQENVSPWYLLPMKLIADVLVTPNIAIVFVTDKPSRGACYRYNISRDLFTADFVY